MSIIENGPACKPLGIIACAFLAIALLPFLSTTSNAQSFGSFNQENIIKQANILRAQFEAAAEAEIRRRMIAEAERAIQNARRGTQADLVAAARRRAADNIAQHNRVARSITEARTTPDRNDEKIAAPPNAALGDSELPFGFTQTDVIVFDDVFGRFNPLRAESILRLAKQNDQTEGVSPEVVEAWNRQVQNAARHRLAEISELRDAAVQSADVALLKRAARMEFALSTYALAAQQKPTPSKPPLMNAPANQ